MKVCVDIHRADLIKFNLVTLPKLRSTYITILLVGLLTFSFIAGSSGLPSSPGDWIIAIVASCVGGVVGLVAGYLISLVFILLSSQSSNGVLGVHEYEISQHGLSERTQANEGLSKWQGIQEIMVLRTCVAFRISGYLFHLVPARHFDSEQEFHSFCERAIAYWNLHGGKTGK